MTATYLAIEQECGCGGNEIAQRLAALCGVPWYDQEIRTRAADVLHISRELAAQYDSDSLLYTLAMLGGLHMDAPERHMRAAQLFQTEQQIIRTLADGGSAIFLGHCAAEALKDRQQLTRVLLTAPPEARQHRIETEYGVSARLSANFVKFYDKNHAIYYQSNVGRAWRDPENYDMVLDSAALGVHGCVEALAPLLRTEG